MLCRKLSPGNFLFSFRKRLFVEFILKVQKCLDWMPRTRKIRRQKYLKAKYSQMLWLSWLLLRREHTLCYNKASHCLAGSPLRETFFDAANMKGTKHLLCADPDLWRPSAGSRTDWLLSDSIQCGTRVDTCCALDGISARLFLFHRKVSSKTRPYL